LLKTHLFGVWGSGTLWRFYWSAVILTYALDLWRRSGQSRINTIVIAHQVLQHPNNNKIAFQSKAGHPRMTLA